MTSDCRILIVEGDDSVFQMLKAGLAIHGIAACVASDGPEATAKIQQDPTAYQAVLMDVAPKKNIKAASTIRQIAPALSIVFMTAADESILAKQAVDFGAELLLKPFHSISEVADTIKAIIGET